MNGVAHSADLTVDFEFVGVTASGEQRTVRSGISPLYAVRDGYLTSARHEFLAGDSVSTGSTIRALVWLSSPEAYPSSLWVGRIVAVFEGYRRIGNATVVRILNPILDRETTPR